MGHRLTVGCVTDNKVRKKKRKEKKKKEKRKKKKIKVLWTFYSFVYPEKLFFEEPEPYQTGPKKGRFRTADVATV
jgi:site-specific recombinase XerD